MIVNGRAAAILQLCNGGLGYEEIVERFSFFYKEKMGKNLKPVYKYLEYLYNNGFITFASTEYLTDSDREKSQSLYIPEIDNSNICIFSHGFKTVDIQF